MWLEGQLCYGRSTRWALSCLVRKVDPVLAEPCLLRGKCKVGLDKNCLEQREVEHHPWLLLSSITLCRAQPLLGRSAEQIFKEHIILKRSQMIGLAPILM